MHSTREQRIEATTAILIRRGVPPERALARAYEAEGLPPPAPGPGTPPLEDENEELRRQLAHERRRADACAARARKARAECDGMARIVAACAAFVRARVDTGDVCPLCGDDFGHAPGCPLD